MRKIKQLHGWGVYELNAKEQSEHGFTHAVIHPDNMGCAGLTPADTDWECESMDEALSWIENYDA